MKTMIAAGKRLATRHRCYWLVTEYGMVCPLCVCPAVAPEILPVVAVGVEEWGAK